MTDGFTRRKEQSKEDIRKAAWELFSQFGVEKVSIVDIARKAGVSQATIYNNFGSKDGLAREFVASVIEQLVSGAEAVLSPSQPYWEKMAGLIQFLSHMLAQGRSAEGAPVFNISPGLLNDPEIQKIRAAAQEKMSAILLRFIQEGKAQRHIRPDLPDEAFQLYFQAFMDLFIDPRFQQRYYRDPRLAQDLGMLMIYGLSGKKD